MYKTNVGSNVFFMINSQKNAKNNEKCNLAKEKKGGTWDSSLSKNFRGFFPDFPISSN